MIIVLHYFHYKNADVKRRKHDTSGMEKISHQSSKQSCSYSDKDKLILQGMHIIYSDTVKDSNFQETFLCKLQSHFYCNLFPGDIAE